MIGTLAIIHTWTYDQYRIDLELNDWYTRKVLTGNVIAIPADPPTPAGGNVHYGDLDPVSALNNGIRFFLELEYIGWDVEEVRMPILHYLLMLPASSHNQTTVTTDIVHIQALIKRRVVDIDPSNLHFDPIAELMKTQEPSSLAIVRI